MMEIRLTTRKLRFVFKFYDWYISVVCIINGRWSDDRLWMMYGNICFRWIVHGDAWCIMMDDAYFMIYDVWCIIYLYSISL